MILNELNILNFKNIAEAQLLLSPKVNCFVGNNAMGKTNVLDAVHFLSFCKSSNYAPDSVAINHNSDFFMLRGNYTRHGEPVEVTLALQRGKRKVLKKDGKDYQRLSAHIGLLPLVMISPADFNLITGTGEERRRLIDQIISQENAQYLAALINYGKALENRNAMIKAGYRDQLLFETVERQLVEYGTYIHAARKNWIEGFKPVFMRYYNAIAGDGEQVSLEYKSHLNEASMQQVLDSNRERDMVLGYTSRGVHRDDIELLLDSHPMRRIGSQGQCKTYTIALRFAQYESIKTATGTKPLLLLDDIFDKLDASRVENIINVVGDDSFGQIFITDTNRENIDAIIRRTAGSGNSDSHYRIFAVENGIITPQ